MSGSCLDRDVLSNYLAGRVDSQIAIMVENHLQQCPHCQAVAADHRPGADLLLVAAHAAIASDPREREPELAAALLEIGKFRSHPAGASAALPPTRLAAMPFVRDYQLIQKLGEGGMGTVYLALHTRLGKTVALKLLKADRTADPQAISRFEREMKAIGKLEHPHIVRALDAGEVDGIYFLVMEYIAGIDLGRLVQSMGPLAIPEACELVRQAALGLHHAHEHGLIHRDVKPPNLMLSPEGQVKVLDLGLAQFQQNALESSELTREGQVVGTLVYMAPENLRGSSRLDARTDVYSLGVTLYNLVAGKLPVERGHPATMLPDIRTLRGDIPEEVHQLLERMMASSPEQRLSSMAEVAASLQPLCSSESARTLARRSSEKANGGAWSAVSSKASFVVPPPPPIASGQATQSTSANRRGVTPPPIALSQPPLPSPASSRNGGAWSPWGLQKKYPRATFVALVTALLAISVLLASNFLPPRRKTETLQTVKVIRPVPPATGSIHVTSADPDVKEIVDQGKLSAVNLQTKARIRLVMGVNPDIPTGSYAFESDDPELVLPPASSNLELAGKADLQLAVGISPPTTAINARLPNQEGALCAYTGTLQHTDLPAGKDVTYYLTLRTMAEEPVDGSLCRWLEVEVTTHSDDGKYVETAWLLVDPKRYLEENKLQVKRGWIIAESAGLRTRMAYLFPDIGLRRLEAAFDPDGDSLNVLAEDLTIELPVDRISVNEALVLFFDAQVHAPDAIARARAFLAKDSKLVPSRQRVQVRGRGELKGWKISSGEAQPGRASYEIQGTPEVPFLFANISIQAAPILTASCRLTAASDRAVKALPNFRVLEENAQSLARLPNPAKPFDVAVIPSEENVRVTFTGTMQLENDPSLWFKASIRTAGPDKKSSAFCWLEIDVESGPEGKSDLDSVSHETTWILIPQTRREDDRFQIKRGWLRMEDETLAFDLSGSVTPMEEALFKLNKELHPSRLKVQQVLSLLFNAQLEGAGDLTRIRDVVDASIVRLGKERVHAADEIKSDSLGLRIPGDAWKVPKEAGLPFYYHIRRSRLIPFNFYSVDFTCLKPKLEIHAALKRLDVDSVADKGDVPERHFDEASLLVLATKTQEAMERRASTADKDNLRIWRDGQGRILAWGEFAGQLRDKNATVVLKSADGKTTTRHLIERLSKADQDWLDEGRVWRNSAGATWRARYSSFSADKLSVNFLLKGKSKTEQYPIKHLDERGQRWLKELKTLRGLDY